MSADWINLPARLSFDPACDCVVCRGRRHRAEVWSRHLAGKDYVGRRSSVAIDVEIPNPNWKNDVLRILLPTNGDVK